MKHLSAVLLLLFSLYAPVAAANKFDILQASELQQNGYISLALIFNAPLNPEVDYNHYIQVTQGGLTISDGSWVVGDGLHSLYFPHVEPGKSYDMRMTADLPAASGETLGEEMKYAVDTVARKASVHFRHQGHILPAAGHRGLPIQSFNQQEVDIDILRVNREDAVRFAGRTSHWNLDSVMQNFQGIQLVHSGRFELSRQRNREVTTQLDLSQIAATSTPGMYIAVIRKPGRYQYNPDFSYFFISDIGLHVRRYNDNLTVFSHSLETAKPKEDVRLELHEHRYGESSKVLASVHTGMDGSAQMNRHDKGKFLLAEEGDDFVLLNLQENHLDLSDFDIGGRAHVERQLMIYSPRDLYRPGETLTFSVLLRSHDGELVEQPPLSARITRPDGKMVKNMLLTPRQAGYYQSTVELPAGAQTGQWQLQLRFDPAAKLPDSRYVFHVEEFLPERMKLNLKAMDSSNNEQLDIDIAGSYLYGAAAANNEIDGQVIYRAARRPLEDEPEYYFGPDDDLKPQILEIPRRALDEQGRTRLSLDRRQLPDDRPSSVRLTANLYESGGRPLSRSLQEVNWPQDRHIGIRPEFDVKQAGQQRNVAFSVLAVNRLGEAVAAQGLHYMVWRLERHYHWRVT